MVELNLMLKYFTGFNKLPLNEQMRLLQGSWGEILSLTLVYRTLESASKYSGKSDSSNSRKASTKEERNSLSSNQNSIQVILWGYFKVWGRIYIKIWSTISFIKIIGTYAQIVFE